MSKLQSGVKKFTLSSNGGHEKQYKQDKKHVLLEEKKEKEKKVVELMIRLYCHKNHKSAHKCGQLCDECEELLEYASQRTEKCPFMAEKTFCSHCKVHCYKPNMKAKIREVMKWSGPRMILYHPVLTIKHTYGTIKIKHLLKNN